MFLSHWLCYWLLNVLFFFLFKKLGPWKAQNLISLILHLEKGEDWGKVFSLLVLNRIFSTILLSDSSLSLCAWHTLSFQVPSSLLSPFSLHFFSTLSSPTTAIFPKQNREWFETGSQAKSLLFRVWAKDKGLKLGFRQWGQKSYGKMRYILKVKSKWMN